MHEAEASAQDGCEQEFLETLDGCGTTFRLGGEEGALQRREDEGGGLVGFECFRQIAGPNRRLQAIGHGAAALGEDVEQLMADGLAVGAGFGGEIAEHATTAHAVLLEALRPGVDIGADALKGRSAVVEQGLVGVLPLFGTVEAEHFQAEGLLGGEMVGEAALRHPGGAHDVAHTGRTEAMLVDQAEPGGEEFFTVGCTCHCTNMDDRIFLSSHSSGTLVGSDARRACICRRRSFVSDIQ